MAKRKSKTEGETAEQTVLAPTTQGETQVGLHGSLQSSPVLEGAVERILSTLDCDGLSQELTTKLAEQLLSKVRVDDIVTSLISEHADELTALMKRRLMEKLLMRG
jgi:hypothetical protein